MKAYLDHVGCRLNQAEMQSLAAELQRRGHRIADSPAGADLILLNTCAVTRGAARDSRLRLRALHAAGPGAHLVAAGCWATLAPGEAGAVPGVRQVVDNAHKDGLAALLDDSFHAPGSPPNVESMEAGPFERTLLPGARLRTRLFVKVQDGCDNRCAFCITRVARGRGRSRPAERILAEINRAVSEGVKEIVLTGVHLGSYGHDRGDRDGLRHLVQAILRETEAGRLRLSSLEPWDLQPEFFDLWTREGRGRLCPHLHLPLQSGCAATLRRMARRTTPRDFAALVAAARQRIPEAAISTDVIAGFPGETEAEFAETLRFVEATRFAGLHVFPYSRREGTAAARLRPQLPEWVKKERARRLRQMGDELARDYRGRFLGRTLPVLWEATAAAGPDGFHWNGYTDNYLRVSLTSPEMLWNTVAGVRLARLTAEGFIGSRA